MTHDHDHDHDDHHHHHGPENPHAGRGAAVLLDIGGEVGALVVTMPAETVGQEVEILPSGDVGVREPAHRPHVAVVDRAVPGGGSLPSLVFPALVEGCYDLMPKGTDDVRLSVSVSGGEVTTTAWPL